MKKYIALFVFFSIFSCSKDNVDYDKENEKDILEYIEANDLDATKSESGLYYVIQKQGEGLRPNSNSNVTVSYKGYYSDGEVFDQSSTNGFSFNLRQVIAGWTEGITYFKEGGEGILLIPSRLGYGYEDYSSIPGGSVLIFDIKLISVD
ncbi:MAG: FKBP-type peptidyl-prolyl cis-trans isomerase [Bacteroidota bacterium]